MTVRRLNPLKYLERPDKWYLGGGNRLVWAPPFPTWLAFPGFWDEAQYDNLILKPVFTWTLLDEKENEIPLRAVTKRWNPSKLRSDFKVSRDGGGKGGPQLEILEEKSCLPNDVLTSAIRVKNSSSLMRHLHLILWTVQEHSPSEGTTWLTNVRNDRGTTNFTKHLQSAGTVGVGIECTLGMQRPVASYAINFCEKASFQPHWKMTPFFETFQDGKLPSVVKLTGVSKDGLVFMALHARIDLKPGGEEGISLFFSAAPTTIESKANVLLASQQPEPIQISEQNWLDHFADVPYFSCSDEYLTRYYWYRWYGLRLLSLKGGEGNYRYPAVCEGIGYFHAPISYSAMCHMLETRWMHTPDLAQGSVLTFIANQRDDGRFPGYIDPYHNRQEMFYHANWGNSVRELSRIHPDQDFLRNVYAGLKKYVQYFDRERDAECSGLYDIKNHYETGQEYMHRYLVVDSNSDKDNWGEIFRLKGVDATVYIYELKKSLAWLATELKFPAGEISAWQQEAETIKRAVLERMWDPAEEMFFDVDPLTKKRTLVKAATCFYPYMTDVVSEEHIKGLKKHLFNPREFWTPFPVPSSSADDPLFSALPEWKGERMNCPWNGRVWPMTNSHIAEALAQSAIRFHDPELRARTVEFITRYLRMMFFDRDAKRPNCFEHYNPVTGQPAIYRGIDDYQHSWIVDLIVKYVVGIRPLDNVIVVDPFPFDLNQSTLDDAVVCGRRLKVERKENDFTVWCNGKRAARSKIGTPVVLALDQ